MYSIEITDITKKYKIREQNTTWRNQFKQSLHLKQPTYLTALNNINFSVNQGEIFGILGPNGAGKTTLIKILAGLLVPEKGTARINGFDIIKQREKVRTSVNILMSGGWIIFDYKLPIVDNLKFWAAIEGVPAQDVKQRVENVLKKVDLFDRMNDYPENLSAGLRQRMNLARCLLSDRPVYLLDEPTTNADPLSASIIQEYIRQLKKEGKSIVLATHNLWEAEQLCDRIAILKKGEVIALDTTSSLKNQIGNEVFSVELEVVPQELIDELSSHTFLGKIIAHKTIVEVHGDVKSHIPFILDICRKYSTVIKCDLQESSLNDIFLYLVQQPTKGEKPT